MFLFKILPSDFIFSDSICPIRNDSTISATDFFLQNAKENLPKPFSKVSSE